MSPDLWGREVGDVVERAHRIIDIAIRRHKPVAVFGMFSGGHDSLCATDIASQHPEFTAAAHVNTGIGIDATRKFVRTTSEKRGWPLKEYHAYDEGQVYETMVMEYGFPGPFGHRKMYARLKERALRTMTREHKTKPKDRVMLITGVRKEESARRMGTVQTINRDGARVWTAPLVDWTGIDKNRHMEARGLERNPVVDLLHMSGECLCGAFAKPGELEWISSFYPEVGVRIRALEDEVRASGQPACKWGQRPPEPEDENQVSFLPMCVGCEGRHG